jgi:hypothetical protein
MDRPSDDTPAWRVFGAALVAFSIVIQLLVSGLLVGPLAAAVDQPELSVICSHSAAGAGVRDDGGVPSTPQSHDQCPACACPQLAKFFATAPISPTLTILRPRSQRLAAYAAHVPADLDFHSPYASRAPPQSA